MTIGGALNDLDNLLNADDIPCYYKPSIKAVMDTIALEQEPKSEWQKDHEILKAYSDGVNEVLDKIRVEIMDTGAYEQETKGRTEFLEGINYCLGVINKYKGESEDT